MSFPNCTLLVCCHVLICLLDVYACVEAFATYDGMIRGYTENLIIRYTLVIKHIIFCCDYLGAHVLNKRFLR